VARGANLALLPTRIAAGSHVMAVSVVSSLMVIGLAMLAYLVAFAAPSAGLLPTMLLIDDQRTYYVVSAVVKALPVLMLGGMAYSAAGQHTPLHSFAQYVAFGEVLGAVGDFFLDLEPISEASAV